MRRRFHMTAQEVAEKIDFPLEKWQGQCAGVAHLLVEHGIVEGREVYGMWRGPMKGYWKDRAHVGFTHHGWIEMADRTVVDPTRWSFEDAPPYIWIGREEEQDLPCEDFDPDDTGMICLACDHVVEEHREDGFFSPCEFCIEWPYDEGANHVREELMGSLPPFDPESMDYSTEGLPEKVLSLLDQETKDHGWLSTVQAAWIANAPIYILEPYAREVYEWIIGIGGKAWIPWDNLEKVNSTSKL